MKINKMSAGQVRIKLKFSKKYQVIIDAVKKNFQKNNKQIVKAHILANLFKTKKVLP